VVQKSSVELLSDEVCDATKAQCIFFSLVHKNSPKILNTKQVLIKTILALKQCTVYFCGLTINNFHG
jgi:hypothetical protein